jgi:hypothetical protein
MTAPTEALPVRYCHGCGQYDDHPRATRIIDINNPALDQLYHYDCVPPEVAQEHPEIQPGLDATAEGKRGQDVRDVMTAHAASIPEAPADTAIEGA